MPSANANEANIFLSSIEIDKFVLFNMWNVQKYQKLAKLLIGSQQLFQFQLSRDKVPFALLETLETHVFTCKKHWLLMNQSNPHPNPGGQYYHRIYFVMPSSLHDHIASLCFGRPPLLMVRVPKAGV